MPVIAVGAAVVADFMAGSALVGGTLTAFEAIAAVGATVAAVGSVTKSKPLQYAGMALGAVGGIGALAQGAGLLGTASTADSGLTNYGALSPNDVSGPASDITSAFADSSGSAAGASGDILNQMTDAGGLTNYGALSPNDVAGAAAGLPPAATDTSTAALPAGTNPGASQPLMDATGNVNNNALVPQPASTNAMSQAEGNAPALTNTPGQPPVVSGSIGSQGTIGAVGAPGSNASPLSPILGQNNPVGSDTSTGTGNAIAAGNNVTGQPAGITGLPPSVTGLPAGVLSGSGGAGSGAANAAAGAGGGGGGGGALSGITDFFHNNQLLSYGAAQALGSLISGMTSTVTPAQVAQLNAQAAANNAAAALVKQQTAAQAEPKSIASLAPVTGAPAPITQTPSTQPILGVPGSLMNGITGAPA